MPGEPDGRVSRLTGGAGALGVDLPADGAGLLLAYLDLVYQANHQLNLTRVEPAAGLERHGVDSLAGLRVLGGEGLTVVDVGTGAGFPGVALAAARRSWRVTLVDSVRKKLRFVEQAAARAGIDNVTALWGRAEELARSTDWRERFDAAVARAVASLPVLLELTLPFVRPGGWVLAYKGPDVDPEVASATEALEKLGGALERVDRFRLPWSGAGRSLIVIRKVRATPDAYPRRAGLPARRPLGGIAASGRQGVPADEGCAGACGGGRADEVEQLV